MKKLTTLLFAIIIGVTSIIAQVAINTDGSAPDNSSILDVKSTDQGFLLPRMTISQRDGISSPTTGLIIFNTEDQSLQVFDGSYWKPITMGSCSPSQPGSITGNATPYQNSTGETYSISAVSGATSYNWTVPSGATIANGQGTTSISVNFGTTNGNVSVRAENGCGESAYTDLAVTLEIPPFVCGDQFTDTRNNKTYNTVLIGSQCWMAENLNIGSRIDGVNNQADNGTIEKYCYNDIEDSCDVYGGLYQWDEMMEYVTTPGAQGICPADWHIPTTGEWQILDGNVDTQYGVGNPIWGTTGWRGYDVGKRLKSTTGWQYNSYNTNASGFTALPGGYRDTDGSFTSLFTHGHWWVSNYAAGSGYLHALFTTYDTEYLSSNLRPYGFSIRCLKD